MNFRSLAEMLTGAFELAGVVALVIGAIIALVVYVRRALTHPDDRSLAYRGLRQGLGRAILVGLELLVAGDIIRTVAVEPSLQSVAVLGIIVLIRTFLSWSLEVEINGEWPWRRAQTQATTSSQALAEEEP